MTASGVALFDTAIGQCGIAWTSGQQQAAPVRVRAVALPELTADRTLRRLNAGRGVATSPPPPHIADISRRIASLLQGQPDDLRDVVVDLDALPQFCRDVLEVTRGIDPGRTLSYGAIADTLGMPGAARAVGRALGSNPCPIIVPCHRVLASDGSMHGFSAAGGIATKRRMLQLEGAIPLDEPTLF